MKNILFGLLYAFLWATAAIAGKFGIRSAEAMLLLDIRLILAGIIILMLAVVNKKNRRLPSKDEWKVISIYGLLGTAIYLGCFFIAIKTVTAGLVNLIVATSPLFVLAVDSISSKRKVSVTEITGMIICLIGIGIASYPSLKESNASMDGILILAAGMVSFAIGNVYYSHRKLGLSNNVFNGWQVLIGGLILLPYILFNKNNYIIIDTNFLLTLLWLVFAVSILAVNLWLYLLKIDPVKASQWIYLTPVIGYLLSWLLLNEPITLFSVIGTLLVIIGLVVCSFNTESWKPGDKPGK